MEKNGVFSMPITTPTYDVGWDSRLRLSSLLRWQQEVGEQHLIGFDLPWQTLAERGFAFVLTRAAGELHRLPQSGEQVHMQTWQQKIEGASFHRGYRLLGEGGERLADCASVFALVDVNTHRLLRPRALDPLPVPSVERADSFFAPPRLRLPELSFVNAGEWAVRRSSVDFNRHLNNTVYADLLTDFLPPDRQEETPRTFQLQFEREARLGDTLAMRHTNAENAAYVEGWRGDTRCFVGCVTF